MTKTQTDKTTTKTAMETASLTRSRRGDSDLTPMVSSPERLEREIKKAKLLQARQKAETAAKAMDEERIRREAEHRDEGTVEAVMFCQN